MSRIRQAMREREEGFTLIELLVVIIIIGILAAIAIPVFLAQRTKGYDASVKSDVRNVATAEETYLTSNPSSYATALLLQSTGTVKAISPSNTLNVGIDAAQGYCIVGTNTNSKNFFLYDSQAGGLSSTTFTSAALAEGACSDKTITAWGTLSETNGTLTAS